LGTNYEAEAPWNTLAGGAKASRCSRCSGGYKVKAVGRKGILQFNKVSEKNTGDHTLIIYYIDGDAGRKLDVSVNGGAAIVIHMPTTGSWHVVGSLSITVYLNAGYNTIEFFNSSAYAPDIDKIVV
jgi:hypothetical protein